MKKKNLGTSSIQIFPLSLGGNVFGWTIDEAQSFKVLDAFTGAGFDFIDTADVYSKWANEGKGGQSETIIGNWMKKRGNRKDLIIATKVGSEMGPGKKGTKKEYIFSAVEESLKRLQTDYIDLYQTHYDDESTPVEETLDAYTGLIKQGKVRAIGASNIKPERLTESLNASAKNNLAKYDTLQPEYNLYAREGYESKYEPICVEHGLGVINYYALASGFLTGKYRSEKDLRKSARGSGMKKYLNERGERILKALDDLSVKYNSTPAQVSIAWLLARPSITAPIASATSADQMKDLELAVQLELKPDDVQQLTDASRY
jgi:aryl-alcohol dehydrogenase-like predicted oxidoreductase